MVEFLVFLVKVGGLAFALAWALRLTYKISRKEFGALWVFAVLTISVLTSFLVGFRPTISYKVIWLSASIAGVSILFFEDPETSVSKRQIVGAAIMLIVPPVLLALHSDAHTGVW